MINRFWRRILRLKRRSLYSPRSTHQIFWFNKQPVLHRGFNSQSLQSAIDELQKQLHAKGYLANLSGRFDLETEQAVRAFQTDHKLFVDGVVGPLTWSCLYYPSLARSSSNSSEPEVIEAIETLKNILRNEGFTIRDGEGCFDADCEQAVKQFQRQHGLKVDGVVGAITWAVILGMRQQVPQSCFRLTPQSWLVCDQLLRVICIVAGMHLNPDATVQPPPLSSAIATAYVLTFVAPLLLNHIPLKAEHQSNLYLLKYAPYVCIGMFWQPVFNGVGTLAAGLLGQLVSSDSTH